MKWKNANAKVQNPNFLMARKVIGRSKQIQQGRTQKQKSNETKKRKKKR